MQEGMGGCILYPQNPLHYFSVDTVALKESDFDPKQTLLDSTIHRSFKSRHDILFSYC